MRRPVARAIRPNNSKENRYENLLLQTQSKVVAEVGDDGP